MKLAPMWDGVAKSPHLSTCDQRSSMVIGPFGRCCSIGTRERNNEPIEGQRLRTIVRLLMREPRRKALLHPRDARALEALQPEKFLQLVTVKSDAVEPPRPGLDSKVVRNDAMLARLHASR